MKLLSSLTTVTAALLFAASTTSAQKVYISIAPGSSNHVKRGGIFTFRLKRPDLPSGHMGTELGVTVGLQECGPKGDDCDHDLTGNNFGKLILDRAPFDPRSLYDDGRQRGLYQDFPINIPTGTAKGKILLKIKRESKDSHAKELVPDVFGADLTVV